MNYVFAEEGKGTSEHTLAEATMQAVQSVLALHKGDHSLSLTIVMDGYDFQNGVYTVHVRILVHDYTQQHDEMYQHMRESEERRLRDYGDHLRHAYFAALHYKQTFMSGQDGLIDQLRDMLDDYKRAHIEEVNLIATEDIHKRLANELGYNLAIEPKPQVYHLPYPTLGPGHGHADYKEAA